MFGARDNRAISLDLLSANSICHPRLNFQRWLAQRYLKSETGIAYAKLKNSADNSQKSKGQNIVKKKSLHDDTYYVSL